MFSVTTSLCHRPCTFAHINIPVAKPLCKSLFINTREPLLVWTSLVIGRKTELPYKPVHLVYLGCLMAERLDDDKQAVGDMPK